MISSQYIRVAEVFEMIMMKYHIPLKCTGNLFFQMISE